MKNYIKEIDSLKYRIKIAHHQWKTKIITNEEYVEILKQLEKDLRKLEDIVFSDTEIK